MNATDYDEDPVLRTLRELRRIDVSPSRAERLRARCHRRLEAQDPGGQVSHSDARGWRQVVGILAGAWCVLYLFETIQRAAAVYWF